MIVTISTVPDEGPSLLGGQQVSAIERITESEPRADTLTDPSNLGSESKQIKKTPFPWAQFSIVLFLQLAEPFSSLAIYPVSLLTGFSLALLLWPRGFAVQALNYPPLLLFRSLHPRSV